MQITGKKVIDLCTVYGHDFQNSENYISVSFFILAPIA